MCDYNKGGIAFSYNVAEFDNPIIIVIYIILITWEDFFNNFRRQMIYFMVQIGCFNNFLGLVTIIIPQDTCISCFGLIRLRSVVSQYFPLQGEKASQVTIALKTIEF